ncbi:hypothetical protein JW978_03945 [Candidatus Dojkabacteria bacterium]|nr:hypothetical protein [Candidatus Dojkabacteria bacterium]
MEKEEGSAVPAEMPKSSMKKGAGSGMKMLILGCVLVGGCLVALLLGGTAYAFFSNKNVPVFSGVVETVENTVATEGMTDEAIQDDVNDFVFSMLADMATEDSGYTKAEAEALIKDKFEADNFRYDATLTADMGDNGSVDLNVAGFTRMANEKSQIDADVTGTYTVQGADMDFAGEMRYTDDVAYLYLSELPASLAQGLGMDATTLTGQWLSMDGSSSADTVSSLGLDQSVTSLVGGTDMTAADLTKLQEFIYSDEMADVLVRTDDEVIEGVRTNCFRMTLDKSGMEGLATKGAEIWEQEVSDSELASIGEGGTLTLDVCSGRRDSHIYKVNATFDFDDGTSLSLNLQLWDYDKVEDAVEVPSDAVSLEEYFTQLYLQSSGMTQEEIDQYNQLLEEYGSEL